MKLLWNKWLYGLGSAVVGGGSSAVVTGVSTMLIDPKQFNITSWPGVAHVLSVMAVNFVLSGILCAFYFLKQSPLPPEVDDPPPKP